MFTNFINESFIASGIAKIVGSIKKIIAWQLKDSSIVNFLLRK